MGDGWSLSFLLDTRNLFQQKKFWFGLLKILKQLVTAKSKCTFSFRDALLAACVETANVSNKQHKILIFQITWDKILKFGNHVRIHLVGLVGLCVCVPPPPPPFPPPLSHVNVLSNLEGSKFKHGCKQQTFKIRNPCENAHYRVTLHSAHVNELSNSGGWLI